MSGSKKEQSTPAWEAFARYQKELSSVDPRIMKSWKRCRAYLNPFQKVQPNRLSEDYMLASQVASFELISVAHPVMEEIFENIEHQGVSVVLVNSAGYVLDLLSDEQGQKAMQTLGIANGVSLTENQCGTNAFSLALIERIPAQVIGANHYLQCLHGLADVAAPLLDWNGAPLGAIGIITSISNYYANHYALAVIAARSIKGQRQSDLLLNQQRSDLAGMRTVMAELSEAILIWNNKDSLIYANPSAEKLFERPASALMRTPFNELANWPRLVRQAVEQKEKLAQTKIMLRFGNVSMLCTITLQFSALPREEEWLIVILRPASDGKQRRPGGLADRPAAQTIELVMESPAMRRVWRQATQAAAAKASVLVLGEPSSGKRSLIQALYQARPQRDGPFILFSCSTIPDDLILEELLGYEKGVLSKRPDGRPSKFELAEGGALYFQDIEHLPLQAQGALLDFLNYNMVQRIGGDQPIPVETRILASSSAALEHLIKEKRFRPELYYRLSSFKITMPPLRERGKDLPLLVDRILERLSAERKRAYRLAPGVLEVLQAYPWPGNIRELESMLENAANQVNNAGIIRLAHLPERLRSPQKFTFGGDASKELRSLPELEEASLVHAARMYRGNMTRMADALQIGRTTVWRKLKKFNISLQDYRDEPVGDGDGEFEL